MDDEDKYLDEILNRNYKIGKAPPAVNWKKINMNKY